METWQQIILGAWRLLFQGTAPEPIIVQQAANWTSIVMAVIAGLPATIAAVVGGMALLQSRRNAEVAAKTGAAIATNIEKTDTLNKTTTEIHTLTNSNLSEVRAELKVSNRTIEGLNQAQVESARRMASMEQLIASLIPPKGEPTPSQLNGAKLDSLKSMVSDMQHGTPPIPVKDEAVLAKLKEITVITDKKLDNIQESADVAAQTAKEKIQDS